MADIQALLSALDVFNGAPDKESLESANAWLQDFQHSPEAWATCNVILLSPDAPASAKVFAAQTFRSKVIYDLSQIDEINLPSLRETLITALQTYQSGPRNIIVQLCLALAGLTLQFPSWTTPVQDMVESFGRNPATVPTLLQFLTLLPEELNNTKIPVTDDEWNERSRILLGGNSKRILELLSMYVQATGVTIAVQNSAFTCLRNWIVAGEIRPKDLAESPLFAFAFEALASDQLFDAAVEVIFELVHETQEIDENMAVIQLILPRLIALKSRLITDIDDPDRIKGYARIFAEAGETYRLLLLQHTDAFFPLVEAIGQCSAYPDLDIVPITFPFWMRLAQTMGKKSSISPLLLDAYKTLMGVIIRHLHFPPDSTPLIGQEAENFRSFRHVMGDTLKDCCVVLRTDTCLLATQEMIAAALSRGTGSISWQEVEAPLFALRSMGAEIDPADNTAVPKIIDLIPSLPDHPRVRYAALLIISRYSPWFNLHPEYISFQLQYVSTGFESPDTEVSAAAGQALRYLCQDCKQHLVDFLPTLHTFLNSTGSKLAQDDKGQVYMAIAHVISAMPMERAGESLRTFSMDILARVHAVSSQPTVASKQELEEVCNGLENLEVMFSIIQSFGEVLPAACQNSCQEAWVVFDNFLSKYGTDYDIAERTTRVLRHGAAFFGEAALPVIPSVVGRMSFAFEATGFPCYLWIAGKMIQRFGLEEDQNLRGSFQEVYERSTHKMVSILQTKLPREIPDVLEDYLHFLLPLSELAPDIFFQSSAFPLAFRAAMAALTVVHSDILFASLDLFRYILTHDSLDNRPNPPPNFPLYASAIHSVFIKEGFEFLGYLLSGLVGEFPEESIAAVVSIFRALAFFWSSQLLSWLPAALQPLSTNAAPNQVKAQFLSEITDAVNSKQFDKVKYSILSLHRASQKIRERRRNGALEG